MNSRHKSGIVLFLVCAIFAAAVIARAQAQSPQVIISWMASSYAPPGYTGKVLPGPGSPMLASVQILDKGKIVNLSGKMIRWYLDGSLIKTSAGNPHVTFAAPDRAAPSSFDLSVQIPGYELDILRSELLFTTIIVPIAPREVVIEAPYPERKFRGPLFTVTGVPYFFNVLDVSPLAFLWTLDGQAVTSTEDKEHLEVRFSRTPAVGAAIHIKLKITVRDPNEDVRAGSKNIILTAAQ